MNQAAQQLFIQGFVVGAGCYGFLGLAAEVFGVASHVGIPQFAEDIYCGDIRRGLAILAMVDIPLTVGAWVFVAPRGNAWLSIGLWVFSLMVSILSIFDAKKTVLGIRDDYRMKDYNHWSVYLIIGIIPTFASAFAVSLAIIHSSANRVTAGSSLPRIGIERKDRFLHWNAAYRNNPPAVGNCITCRDRLGTQNILMDRVTALPGGFVETAAGRIIVPAGCLGVERGASDGGAFVISEMAVAGKLVYRFWPVTRRGNPSEASGQGA